MTLELVHSASPFDLDRSEPREDHAVISRLVKPNAKVLEIGCGDGALMRVLQKERSARVRGLEIDQGKVNACVARGLSVVQGDADRDLMAFPAQQFDVVILSHSLQALRRPRLALKQAARIGERVIVSVKNAAHWRSRFNLLTKGRVAGAWDQTHILHQCSVRDIADLAHKAGLVIERGVPMSNGSAGAPFAKTLWRANWFAQEAVFLLAPT